MGGGERPRKLQSRYSFLLTFVMQPEVISDIGGIFDPNMLSVYACVYVCMRVCVYVCVLCVCVCVCVCSYVTTNLVMSYFSQPGLCFCVACACAFILCMCMLCLMCILDIFYIGHTVYEVGR